MIFNLVSGSGGGGSFALIHVPNGLPYYIITATGTNTYSVLSNSKGECYIPVYETGTYSVDLGSVTRTVSVSKLGEIVEANAVSSDYTPLSYIQSSGSQYCDTGFTPNQETNLHIDAQILTLGQVGIYGARQTYVQRTSTILIDSNGYWDSGYNTDRGVSSVTANTNRHVFRKMANYTLMDEAPLSHVATGTFTAPNSAILFGYKNAGSVDGLATMRLYRAILWAGSTLSRDYHPAQRKSDSVYGLYDAKNDQFLQNAGSGSFTGA